MNMMEQCCGDMEMGWMMMLFGLLTVIAVIAAVAVAVYLVARALRRNPADPAISILEERFARGEIDADEYQRRRSTLGAG